MKRNQYIYRWSKKAIALFMSLFSGNVLAYIKCLKECITLVKIRTTNRLEHVTYTKEGINNLLIDGKQNPAVIPLPSISAEQLKELNQILIKREPNSTTIKTRKETDEGISEIWVDRCMLFVRYLFKTRANEM